MGRSTGSRRGRAALYGSFGLAFGDRTLRLARSLVDPEEPLGSSFALTVGAVAVIGLLCVAMPLTIDVFWRD